MVRRLQQHDEHGVPDEMAQAFAASTTINRPAHEVWLELTNWRGAHRWMPSVEQVTADGPTHAGTALKFRARGKDRPSLIASVDPGRSIVLRSVQGGVTADYRYSVIAMTDDRTEVTLHADCQTTGAWKLVGPLLRVAMRRSDSGQLDELRRVLNEQG